MGLFGFGIWTCFCGIYIVTGSSLEISYLKQFFLTQALRTIGRYLNSCLELKIYIPVSAKSKDVTAVRASEGNR